MARTDLANRWRSRSGDDEKVLIALYDATNGANWNTAWWKSSSEKFKMRLKGHGRWPGVTTDAAKRVTALVLTGNGLSGPLPPILGKLPYLKELRLGGNQLSGPIPNELGELGNLEYLDLHDNQLSGSVPEPLRKLKLKELRLDGNQLSGPILLGPGDPGVPQRPEPHDDQPSEPVRARSRESARLKEPASVGNEPSEPLAPKTPDRGTGDLVGGGGGSRSVALPDIEDLLLAIEPPVSQTAIPELLESYLRLVRILKEKVGTLRHLVADGDILLPSIEKIEDDLRETEKRIADVQQRGREVEQQSATLEARTMTLKARKTELEHKMAALQASRANLERTEELLAELQTENDRIEETIVQIDGAADFTLHVDAVGQKFSEQVDHFLKSDHKRREVMRQLTEMLRRHLEDDTQIVDALQRCEHSGSQNVDAAVELVGETAKSLGELDRLLGSLVTAGDSTE